MCLCSESEPGDLALEPPVVQLLLDLWLADKVSVHI